ncbi:MAG: LptF/LptG family permease [Parvularculaceae bacterium]
MRRLDVYVFRQLLTPLVVGLVAVTTLVWLTQSLQRLDIVIDHGEAWSTFAFVTTLLIPNLLSVVLPFAVFGATLFALQRLHADSEVAVIFASGVSRLRIAAPILALAGIAAAMAAWISHDLMPRSYRALKREVAEIRADVASAALRSGEFTTISKGFTVYVEEALPQGRFRGLLINDYRDRDKVETYMAERGVFRETVSGPVLYLFNGNIQTPRNDALGVDIVHFERTAFNISDYSGGPGQLQLELTERYLGELLNPDPDDAWAQRNAATLKAEGHSRLAAPLYPIAFALIAVVALIGGPYARRGYAARIALACVLVGVLKIAAIFTQNLAAAQSAYWAIYALPAIALVAAFWLLKDCASGPRKPLRAAPDAPAPLRAVG